MLRTGQLNTDPSDWPARKVSKDILGIVNCTKYIERQIDQFVLIGWFRLIAEERVGEREIKRTATRLYSWNAYGGDVAHM